MTAYSSFS